MTELAYPGSGSPHPLVENVLAATTRDPSRVARAVASADEMLSFGLATRGGDFDLAIADYFQSGARIVESLRQIVDWRFGGFDRLERYLDFASGWGRVTRFLTAELPAERIWIAEIVAPAVDFQRRELGVHGLFSVADPREFVPEDDPAGNFDVIVVTSLFTHLPAHTFTAWLHRLSELLRPGGLLIFSAHDVSLLPPNVPHPENGIRFEAISESLVLDTAEYGSTWVSYDYVSMAVATIAAELGEALSLHRLSRGYCNFHDLYLVTREAATDFSTLTFERDPEGYFDYALPRDGGGFRLSGWSAYPTPSPGVATGEVSEVELWVDGKLAARAPVDGPRADLAASLGRPEMMRAGWAVEGCLPTYGSSTTTPLLIQVRTRRGHPTVLYQGTLAMALLQSVRSDLAQRGAELAAAYDHTSQLNGTITWLQQTIRGMEASRFWKAREAWWRLRRRLGV